MLSKDARHHKPFFYLSYKQAVLTGIACFSLHVSLVGRVPKHKLRNPTSLLDYNPKTFYNIVQRIKKERHERSKL